MFLINTHHWLSERSERSHTQFMSIEICGMCRFSGLFNTRIARGQRLSLLPHQQFLKLLLSRLLASRK